MAKILLVEDDKSLCEIYGVRLSAEGYQIISAGDGEQALALAVKEAPDLIISDVMMPKISGFDMLDILRSTPETKDMKVIVMTALSSEDQRQRGETLGANRYLVKSQVGIEDVVRTVHDVLADIPASGTPAPNIFSTPPLSASMSARPAQPSMPAMPQANMVQTPQIQPSPAQPIEPTPPAPAPTPVPAQPIEPTPPAPNPTPSPAMQIPVEQATPPVASQAFVATPSVQSAPSIVTSAVEPTPPTPIQENIPNPAVETFVTTPAPLEPAMHQSSDQLINMPPQPQMDMAQEQQMPPYSPQPPTTPSPTMTQFARPSVAPTPFSPPEFSPQSDKTIHPVDNVTTDMNALMGNELNPTDQPNTPQMPPEAPTALNQ